MSGLVEIDFDEISNYLVEKGVCTAEEAISYLEAEDDYYDSIGLNVYDEDEIDEEMSSSDRSTAPVVDQRDVDAYIVEHTDLEPSKVDDITGYLMEYLYGYDVFADPEDMED
ncbi:MAG: hypothetical protein J5819_00895 [Eubacterium sp.]|nr:hypothetical protein [Eubacterium sp.]